VVGVVAVVEAQPEHLLEELQRVAAAQEELGKLELEQLELLALLIPEAAVVVLVVLVTE
jgi:hypothetical protein